MWIGRSNGQASAEQKPHCYKARAHAMQVASSTAHASDLELVLGVAGLAAGDLLVEDLLEQICHPGLCIGCIARRRRGLLGGLGIDIDLDRWLSLPVLRGRRRSLLGSLGLDRLLDLPVFGGRLFPTQFLQKSRAFRMQCRVIVHTGVCTRHGALAPPSRNLELQREPCCCADRNYEISRGVFCPVGYHPRWGAPVQFV